MKQWIITTAAASAMVVAGCESSGLSPREVPGRTQSALLYSMYDNLDFQGSGPTQPLRLPARVAVVQVGEVAPPQAMMDVLRKEPGVFARVESLPGSESHVPEHAYKQESAGVPRKGTTSDLRRMAADMGMQYVLLVGGSIDYGSTGTPMSLLDITIVGAFIVPSRETKATAKATAALVDVKTGRVVANSSSEAKSSSVVPTGSLEGERMRLLEKLRDKVVAKLGEQVLADVKNRAISADALLDAGELGL